jgi:hypothetical protein
MPRPLSADDDMARAHWANVASATARRVFMQWLGAIRSFMPSSFVFTADFFGEELHFFVQFSTS